MFCLNKKKLSPNIANVNSLEESSGNNNETVLTESIHNSFDSTESGKEIEKQSQEPSLKEMLGIYQPYEYS